MPVSIPAASVVGLINVISEESAYVIKFITVQTKQLLFPVALAGEFSCAINSI